MNEEEINEAARCLNERANRGDVASILATLTLHVIRLTVAQETMVAMAQQDLEDVVKEAAEQRGAELAAEAEEARQRRSFIGRKFES